MHKPEEAKTQTIKKSQEEKRMENNNTSLAITKLTDELTAFKGDRYGEVVKEAVAEALMDFCNKSEEFAAIIAASDKTLSDCIVAIMKGCGKAISDIEVYRRAVRFYCPGADIQFDMVISLPGKEAEAQEPATPRAKLINIFDIL